MILLSTIKCSQYLISIYILIHARTLYLSLKVSVFFFQWDYAGRNINVKRSLILNCKQKMSVIFFFFILLNNDIMFYAFLTTTSFFFLFIPYFFCAPHCFYHNFPWLFLLLLSHNFSFPCWTNNAEKCFQEAL